MYYDNYFEELKFALTKIDRNLLVGIESMIIKTVKKDGNIYLLGNGGNTATASHWVCDFNKGIGILSDKSVRMISLSDNISIHLHQCFIIGVKSILNITMFQIKSIGDKLQQN